MQRIDLRAHRDKRLAIGLLLLVLAAFCIARGCGPNGLTSSIFGICVGFLGILAVCERHFAVIDRQAGTFTRKRGLILAFPFASLAIADIRSVELRSRSTNKGKTTLYRVNVSGAKHTVLAEYGDEWYARAIGERLSAALRLPFDNVVYDRHSVRKSDELDLPLAERWRIAGKIKERPALAAGSRLEVEDLQTEVRVHFPADSGNLKWLALFALCVVLVAVPFYVAMDEGSNRILFYLAFGVAFGLLGLGALASSGRSRVTFTDRTISFRSGVAPMERSIELRSVEEMIVSRDSIYLVSDSAHLSIDWPTSSEDRHFLKAFVAYEISRRHAADASG